MSLGLSARLITRFGARQTLLPGLVLVAAGLVLFRGVPTHASYAGDLLPSMVLMGIGAGLAFPSLMTLAMSAATAEDSGLASGLVNTTQQVGGALGLAVLATLSTTHTNTLLHQRRFADVVARERLPPRVHDRRDPRASSGSRQRSCSCAPASRRRPQEQPVEPAEAELAYQEAA